MATLTSDSTAAETTAPGGTISPGTVLGLKLRKTVLAFEKNPMTATREIREYSEKFPNEFLESSVGVLLDTVDTPGGIYLLKMLLAHGSLISLICSPFHLRKDQAHLLVERSKRLDPFFEVKLFRQAADEVERGCERNAEISMRALDLLAITARSAHQIPVVKKLLQHPNAKVRSRAATLMAKITRELDWAPDSLHDAEARVRANALEAFWGPGVPQNLTPLLWQALSDTDNRVVGNALLALYRQGDHRTICLMLEMATDPVEKFRATAVWLLGQTAKRDLLPQVQQMVRDSSPMVRRAAVRAARNLNAIPLPVKPPTADSGDSTAANDNTKTVETVDKSEASSRLKLLLEKSEKVPAADSTSAPHKPGDKNRPDLASKRHSSTSRR